MQRYIIILLIIFTCLSCGKKIPVAPDSEGIERMGSAFPWVNTIFPGPGVGGEGIFYDADISEIVQGPGLNGQEGTLWTDTDGRHWAVAVALREGLSATNGMRQICYRFLSEDGIMSPVFEAPVDPDIIRLARVDACYFYTSGNPDLAFTNVEVGIVYQFWAEDVDPVEDYNLWRIGICRMAFYPGTIRQNGTFLSTLSYNRSLIPPYQNDKHGSGQMMPDIAYDPRSLNPGVNGKGDIYIVFTYYNALLPSDTDGPHVYMKYCNRFGDSFTAINYHQLSLPVLIQEIYARYGLGLCAGFHPGAGDKLSDA